MTYLVSPTAFRLGFSITWSIINSPFYFNKSYRLSIMLNCYLKGLLKMFKIKLVKWFINIEIYNIKIVITLSLYKTIFYHSKFKHKKWKFKFSYWNKIYFNRYLQYLKQLKNYYSSVIYLQKVNLDSGRLWYKHFKTIFFKLYKNISIFKIKVYEVKKKIIEYLCFNKLHNLLIKKIIKKFIIKKYSNFYFLQRLYIIVFHKKYININYYFMFILNFEFNINFDLNKFFFIIFSIISCLFIFINKRDIFIKIIYFIEFLLEKIDFLVNFLKIKFIRFFNNVYSFFSLKIFRYIKNYFLNYFNKPLPISYKTSKLCFYANHFNFKMNCFIIKYIYNVFKVVQIPTTVEQYKDFVMKYNTFDINRIHTFMWNLFLYQIFRILNLNILLIWHHLFFSSIQLKYFFQKNMQIAIYNFFISRFIILSINIFFGISIFFIKIFLIVILDIFYFLTLLFTPYDLLLKIEKYKSSIEIFCLYERRLMNILYTIISIKEENLKIIVSKIDEFLFIIKNKKNLNFTDEEFKYFYKLKTYFKLNDITDLENINVENDNHNNKIIKRRFQKWWKGHYEVLFLTKNERKKLALKYKKYLKLDRIQQYKILFHTKKSINAWRLHFKKKQAYLFEEESWKEELDVINSFLNKFKISENLFLKKVNLFFYKKMGIFFFYFFNFFFKVIEFFNNLLNFFINDFIKENILFYFNIFKLTLKKKLLKNNINYQDITKNKIYINKSYLHNFVPKYLSLKNKVNSPFKIFKRYMHRSSNNIGNTSSNFGGQHFLRRIAVISGHFKNIQEIENSLNDNSITNNNSIIIKKENKLNNKLGSVTKHIITKIINSFKNSSSKDINFTTPNNYLNKQPKSFLIENKYIKTLYDINTSNLNSFYYEVPLTTKFTKFKESYTNHIFNTVKVAGDFTKNNKVQYIGNKLFVVDDYFNLTKQGNYIKAPSEIENRNFTKIPNLILNSEKLKINVIHYQRWTQDYLTETLNIFPIDDINTHMSMLSQVYKTNILQIAKTGIPEFENRLAVSAFNNHPIYKIHISENENYVLYILAANYENIIKLQPNLKNYKVEPVILDEESQLKNLNILENFNESHINNILKIYNFNKNKEKAEFIDFINLKHKKNQAIDNNTYINYVEQYIENLKRRNELTLSKVIKNAISVNKELSNRSLLYKDNFSTLDNDFDD